MGVLDNKKLVKKAAEAIGEKRGENTVVYDVRELTSFTDFILMTTVKSSVQIEAVIKDLKKNIKRRPDHVEGKKTSGWVLVDYGGVIINVFLPDCRDFYNLERIWGEAKKIKCT